MEARGKTITQVVSDALGLDPNIVYRSPMLPLAYVPDDEGKYVPHIGYDGKVRKLKGNVAPQFLVDLVEAVMLPGHVAKGGDYNLQDVAEMALDTAMVAAPVGYATAPRKALTMGGGNKNAAFRKGFAKTKAVDELGQPIKVYHGTNAHAYMPGESIKVYNTRPASGRGASFHSSSKKLAQQYGEKVYEDYLRLENPLVVYGEGRGWADLDANMKIGGLVTSKLRQAHKKRASEMDDIFRELDLLEGKQPRDYKTASAIGDSLDSLEGMTLEKIPGLDGNRITTDEIAKVARGLGYDGVIFKDIKDSPTAGVDYKPIISDIFAVFDPKNIKAADNKGTWNFNDPNRMNANPSIMSMIGASRQRERQASD